LPAEGLTVELTRRREFSSIAGRIKLRTTLSPLASNDLFDFVFKALPIRRLLFIEKVDDRLIEFCRLLQVGEMTASFDHS
jgi:hypothetical protein